MQPGEIYHLDNVPDPRGRNLKGRFVVIVTNAEDILPVLDEPILVVCCSGTVYPAQVEAGKAIELPWHPEGITQTRFRRATCVIPHWLLRIRPSQLGRLKGVVPGNVMAAIIERLPPDPVGDLCSPLPKP